MYFVSSIACESVCEFSTCPRLMTAMIIPSYGKVRSQNTVMVIVLLAHSCPASVNICRNGSSINDTVQDSKTYLDGTCSVS